MPDEGSRIELPGWRITPAAERRGWRGWINRSLAQAEVAAPDGTIYQVRISKSLPLRGSGLDGLADALPSAAALALIVGGGVARFGETGWRVEILIPETAWRAARPILAEQVRHGRLVADVALAMVNSIQRGERPWEDD